ncbi:glycosyltransferase family 2 protein [Actinocrispum sp. NPDC049592]|uniref:glycosyltransferase family 2 protein n=1 Tax=Actinocrispum sp. NPDC049592 TaxID=3154835 RepID=UPI0034199306
MSVLILAKDEQRCIARCLDSVVGHGFGVIVADTGSTDGTLGIVAGYRDHGVRVVPTPWSGSFADARNAALESVVDGWVLCLDADEWLAEGAAADLVSCLVSLRDKDCSQVVLAPVIRDVDHGSYRDDIPRILRVDGPVRYRGQVHEYLVVRGAVDTPPERVAVDVEIRHDGYNPAVFAAKRKRDRNMSLVAQARASDPDNPRWLYFALRDGFPSLSADQVADLCETMRGLTGIEPRTGDRQSAAEYYRYALSLACQGMAGRGNWSLVERFCAELERLRPGGDPDARYFRLVFELLHGVPTTRDLLGTIRLRKDDTLVSTSGLDPAGGHLDALIAALLERLRGSAVAEQYRAMSVPWTDGFFKESRPRW